MILTKSQVPFSLFCLSLEVTLILVGLRLHPEAQLSPPFIPQANKWIRTKTNPVLDKDKPCPGQRQTLSWTETNPVLDMSRS